MSAQKVEKRLFYSLVAFLALGGGYFLCYSPIHFHHGLKVFDLLYSPGDVNTYLEFAKKEIDGHSFFEWYLKLNFNNISLVYFSWIQSFLMSLSSYEIVATSSVILFVYWLVAKILNEFKSDSLFSSLSLLASFSMLIYMQTYTKELLIVPFLLLAIWGVARRDSRLVVGALFCLCLLRIYFALILILSLFLLLALRKAGKKGFVTMGLVVLVTLPVLIIKTFPQFLNVQNVQSEFGVSSFYHFSFKYLGLSLIWLPFKILQNIIEPFLAFFQTPVASLIFATAYFLNFLTSCILLLLLTYILLAIKKVGRLPAFCVFLSIFVLAYLSVVGSLPIVHFRYVVPLVPVLGIFADLLAAKLKNQSS